MRSNGSPLAGQLGELGQDVAAALRLLAQQPHVVGVRRSSARVARSSSLAITAMVDERRAELVRGGRGKPVELRQMLLARQHQLGRGQRVGELARFLGDLPGVDADEADREQDREPHAHHVDRRQLQRIVAASQGSG